MWSHGRRIDDFEKIIARLLGVLNANGSVTNDDVEHIIAGTSKFKTEKIDINESKPTEAQGHDILNSTDESLSVDQTCSGDDVCQVNDIHTAETLDDDLSEYTELVELKKILQSIQSSSEILLEDLKEIQAKKASKKMEGRIIKLAGIVGMAKDSLETLNTLV